jgi:uncharacterized protein
VSEQCADMCALVEQIAKALVDAPDQVFVNQVEENQVSVLELEVAESDMGRVIGRSGRTAKAMRTLLAAAELKFGKHYELEILQ